MSPRAAFICTLMGVLVVGIPLPLLTVTPVSGNPSSKQAPDQAAPENVYAILRFTGQPESIQLRHNGHTWDIDASLNTADQELELRLTSTLEIELKARWASTEAQAVTLTLEPDGRESRSETHWKDENSTELHQIYTFRW